MGLTRFKLRSLLPPGLSLAVGLETWMHLKVATMRRLGDSKYVILCSSLEDLILEMLSTQK
jgi:hypothetical protein